MSRTAMDDADYSRREAKAVEALKEAIPSGYRSAALPASRGMFVELYSTPLFPEHYLAAGIDGAGTKVIVAQLMQRYDTIGIDLVAMNANDLAAHPCNGHAAPFLFMDYLAIQGDAEEQEISRDIMRGVISGLGLCDASDVLRMPFRITVGKGETASMDEVIAGPVHGYGFDIAGAMIGFIQKDKTCLHTPTSGDTIIALRSSGPHCSGYTELRTRLLTSDVEYRPEFRKRYTGRFTIDDAIPGSTTTIGEALLEPTLIYTKAAAAIARDLYAMERDGFTGINSTGYGLHNFSRVGHDVEYWITDPMMEQDIFRLVQEESGFGDREMYRKFNMGMGFFVVAERAHADTIVKTARSFGYDAQQVGAVRKGSGAPRTVLKKRGREIVFRGYG